LPSQILATQIDLKAASVKATEFTDLISFLQRIMKMSALLRLRTLPKNSTLNLYAFASADGGVSSSGNFQVSKTMGVGLTLALGPRILFFLVVFSATTSSNLFV